MKKFVLSAAAAAFSLAATASANVTVLDFEGILVNPSSADNQGQILEFYNGGVSEDGTSGTDFGVSFQDNALALCLNTLDRSCSNTSRGSGVSGNTRNTAMFFLTGDAAVMNVAAGFENGFSFNYTSPFSTGTVEVYDGLDGTGNLLASFSLATTPEGVDACPDFNAQFCPFEAAGVAFSGVARSVLFGIGLTNNSVFDDITFGSATPGPTVPVPGAALLFAPAALVLRKFGKKKAS